MAAEVPVPIHSARPLVPIARRPIPTVRILVVLLLALGYLIAAAVNPFMSQSLLAVMIQTMLFAFAMGFILMSPNGDRLGIFTIASIFWIVTFCVGDLFNEPMLIWFFEDTYENLLTRATALALMGFVMMALGYYLPIFGRLPESIPARHERLDPNRVALFGLVLFVIGVLFYAVYFQRAGGFSVIVAGEGEVNRAHFGRAVNPASGVGLGIYFWPALWMTSGATLYFAAKASRPRRYPWLAAWPLVAEFVLLMLLQGRHRALGPLLMALVIGHYLIRPVRLPRIALYGAIGVLFSISVAIARQPSVRSQVFRDPTLLVRSVSEDFYAHIASLMSTDLGRTVMVMIIVDKVPTVRPYAWGNSLLIPFNPLLRITGLDAYQGLTVGDEGYLLARPEVFVRRDLAPGFLPSLIGEFRWNFPWPICAIWYLLYGVVLRVLYQRTIVKHGDFVSVAIYAAFGLYLVEMIFQSPTQNVFEMLDVVVPMFVVRFLCRRAPRVPLAAPASPPGIQQGWAGKSA